MLKLKKGCDFSHWNSNAIFNRYKDMDFAIIKATQNRRYIDNTFAVRVMDLIEHNKNIGVYHFLSHDIKGQANHFYNTISSYLKNYIRTDGTVKMLCIVDVEADATINDLITFVNEWFMISNLPLIIYTSVSWFNKWKKQGNKAIMDDLRLYWWLSGWTKDYATIRKRLQEHERILLYQFTDKYEGFALDCNYYVGDKWGYKFNGKGWDIIK